MEWQPIETAPKDTPVIVYCPCSSKKVFEAIVYGGDKYSDPVYDEWFGRGAAYWMPLPEPPKEK